MTKSLEEIVSAESRVVLQTYKRAPLCMVRGAGAYVYDQENRSYLDFSSGIAVNALGHAHPVVLKAIAEQAAKLIHTSNLYYTQPMIELASALVEQSFADKVFFSNSGTEANEAALKFARLWGKRQSGEKVNFVAFDHSFHGRTLGALSVTGKDSIRTPFSPLVPEASFGVYNDLSATAPLLNEKVAAVILEPIQGEGGVHLADIEFMRGLRKLCDERSILLIFDEVQCGLGRTGKLWAHENFGVYPDMMTLAKPLGGGLPIGATLVTEKVANAVKPGEHGTTFGGNALACHVGHEVFKTVADHSFLRQVEHVGEELREILFALQNEFPNLVTGSRGKGLMWGLDLSVLASQVIELARGHGLILISAGDQTIRLLPPLIINSGHLAEFKIKLHATLQQINRENTPPTNS